MLNMSTHERTALKEWQSAQAGVNHVMKFAENEDNKQCCYYKLAAIAEAKQGI